MARRTRNKRKDNNFEIIGKKTGFHSITPPMHQGLRDDTDDSTPDIYEIEKVMGGNAWPLAPEGILSDAQLLAFWQGKLDADFITEMGETPLTFANLLNFLYNRESAGGGDTQYIFAPAADLDALKAIDVTTLPSAYPDRWVKYVEGEDAMYALDRQMVADDDSTSTKRYIRPTLVADDDQPIRWVRISNLNRTFDTKEKLFDFLAQRPNGEIGQVQKSYARTPYAYPGSLTISSAEIAVDSSRSILLNQDVVIITNLSTGVHTSVTESGYVAYEGIISRFDTNMAAIRWHNNASTLFKITLVNLTTGVKTQVPGAASAYSSGMDFAPGKLILANDESLQVVNTATLAVTTLALTDGMLPNKVRVNESGARAAACDGNLEKVALVALSDNSIDYIDVQGQAAEIAWAFDINLNANEFLGVFTYSPQGITTISATPGNNIDFEVKNYPLPEFEPVNQGWQQQSLGVQPYYGNFFGSIENLIVELNPYNGKIYTYNFPTEPVWVTWSTNGQRFFYQDSYENMYMFNWIDLKLHYLGPQNMYMYALAALSADDTLVMIGDSQGAGADVVKLSGLGVNDNGVYQFIDNALWQIYPDLIFRNLLLSPINSGGDYATQIAELIEANTAQEEVNESVQLQLEELATTGIGTETFPIQNGLTIGKLYYKTSPTVYVQSSPATEGTAKVRGIVVGSTGGNLIGRLAGTTITASEISAVTTAGVTINGHDTFYLAGSGSPETSPPTTPGYFLKPVLRQGNLVDETATEIGLEDYSSIEVNADGTDVVPEYASRLTVTGNSPTAIVREVSLVGVSDGKKLSYINKGVGTLTIDGVFSGVTDPVLDQYESIELEFFNGAYYIKNRFTI